MQRFAYSTEDLPPDYDEQARLTHWQDFAASIYGAVDCIASRQDAFSVSLRFTQFGHVGVGDFAGTVTYMARARAIDADGMFTLGVGRGNSVKRLKDGPREAVLAPGSALLLEGAGRNSIISAGNIACMSVHLPRRSLLDLVPDAENRFCNNLADTPAARHLYRYLDFVSMSDDAKESPELGASIAATLVDLIALALGAGRDTTEMAGARGLRAARIQEILQMLQKRFADPGFCADNVAEALGVTPRYVQQLLHETGRSFGERVLELRLLKSRAMLGDARCDRLRVGEIALACGFADAGYFNRCFRRRFGTTPTQYRGSVA